MLIPPVKTILVIHLLYQRCQILYVTDSLAVLCGMCRVLPRGVQDSSFFI